MSKIIDRIMGNSGSGVNEGGIFGMDDKVDGFVVVDRSYSDNDGLPTFMLANIEPVTTDIEYNLKRIRSIATIARNNNVNVMVLPELPISGYVWHPEDGNKDTVFDHLRACDNRTVLVSNTINYIRGLMSSDGLNLVFLNNVRVDGDDIYDTTFVISHDNDYNNNYYDKIFLTPIEKEYFKTGSDQRLVVDSKWGRFGVTICYDLCFVGLGKKYAFDDNVDAVINSAAWRRDSVREYDKLNYRIDNYYEYIWDLKHASLSSYNQVWSIGCTCVGTFDRTGNAFCGGSGFWSPSGIPVFQGSKVYEELLILRNLDITKHMRNQAVEDFDYSLDFNKVWREVRDLEPEIIRI